MAKQKSSTTSNYTYTFICKADTRPGQELYLTGNITELGNESLDNALHLTYVQDGHWAIELNLPASQKSFEYQYLIKQGDAVIHEAGTRTFRSTQSKRFDTIRILDTFDKFNFPEHNLGTSLFQNLYHHDEKFTSIKQRKQYNFKIHAPLASKDWALGILGGCKELGSWNKNEFVPFKPIASGVWEHSLDISDPGKPIEYKYIIFNKATQEFLEYESGENRRFLPAGDSTFVWITDSYFQYPKAILPRLAGVAIPVFSLRSNRSCGVGEFLDLMPFGEWANDSGMKLIQILPINDTTANYSWTDSYPYAAISVFALHPQYLNLEAIPWTKPKGFNNAYKAKIAALNALDQIDYEAVMDFKVEQARQIFDLNKDRILGDSSYQAFLKENETWLKPYAAFCVLRDEYGTPEFTTWPAFSAYNQAKINSFFDAKSKRHTTVHYWCFVQWQLHLQLMQAVEYLRSIGVGLKGDLPIGIYRHSTDAWVAPLLYNQNMQAGAPPDDFSVNGQNWGFPTYNWDIMAQDDYQWWRQRFQKLEQYFDAFRIDHILGFFRIWQIPLHATQGILGYFNPALPFTPNELNQWGFWYNEERLTKPFITEQIVRQYFPNNAEQILSDYFDLGANGLQFKEIFSTQRLLTEHAPQENDVLQKLLELHANVLFLKEEFSDGEAKLHPRFNLHHTTSFQNLPLHEQQLLKKIHDHYFYHRHEEFWKQKGMEKLPQLKQATNMLVCGEDLGLVPKSVPQVMDDLSILSLEIQRMPSDADQKFTQPLNADYWTVVSPSSHDTSTLRLWWEENRESTQYFYNHILENWGLAPQELSPEIARQIIDQHFMSPAILAVIPLQDLLAIDSDTTWAEKDKERINVPAIMPHYWRYRMHLNIEELKEKHSINQTLKNILRKANRVFD